MQTKTAHATREIHNARINGESVIIAVWSDGPINVKRMNSDDYIPLAKLSPLFRMEIQALLQQIG